MDLILHNPTKLNSFRNYVELVHLEQNLDLLLEIEAFKVMLTNVVTYVRSTQLSILNSIVKCVKSILVLKRMKFSLTIDWSYARYCHYHL
jgi:hypothetical protein